MSKAINIKTRLQALEASQPKRPIIKLHQEPGNPKLYCSLTDYGGPRLSRKEWEKQYPDHEIIFLDLSAADREMVLQRRRDVMPILENLQIMPPDWWGLDPENE